MTDMTRLLAATSADEGFRATPYRDTQDLWTIGEGRCLETHPLSGPEWKALLDAGQISVSITHDGADSLMREQLLAIEAKLAADYRDFWAQLNDARQNALIEMAYQLGVEHEEEFHDMLGDIRIALRLNTPGAWGAVRAAGLNSLWAKQTPARAVRVMTQLATGQFQ
ncbi:MAG: glycoside hydrolase family protein [Steroidobacteraceae bacterium]